MLRVRGNKAYRVREAINIHLARHLPIHSGRSFDAFAHARILSRPRRELVFHVMQLVAHASGFAGNSLNLSDDSTGALRDIFRGSSRRAQSDCA